MDLQAWVHSDSERPGPRESERFSPYCITSTRSPPWGTRCPAREGSRGSAWTGNSSRYSHWELRRGEEPLALGTE